MSCLKCEKVLNDYKENVVQCQDCGQIYILFCSVFEECSLDVNGNGEFVARLEKGPEITINPEEWALMESQPDIDLEDKAPTRQALPFTGELKEGEKPPMREALPFPGRVNRDH